MWLSVALYLLHFFLVGVCPLESHPLLHVFRVIAPSADATDVANGFGGVGRIEGNED